MPAYTRQATESPAGAPVPALSNDIVVEFERNMDAALADMAPSERLSELNRIKVRFIALSERFAARVDSGIFPEFGESAVDYALMIAAIEKRIAAETRQ